jgi:putative flippase GtrA
MAKTKNMQAKMDKRDYYFGTAAGLLIGLLFLPVLKAAKPDFFSLKIAMVIVPFFAIATPIGLLVAHYIGRKIYLVWQLAKFVVTGGLNALVDLGVLSMLVFFFRSSFGIDAKKTILTLGIAITFYSLYKATSFIIANINSYFWNKYWTFEKKSTGKAGVEFFQFFVVSFVGFLINVIVASYVFKSIPAAASLNSDQWGLIGAAAGSIAGLVWNFVGYKFWVFKK